MSKEPEENGLWRRVPMRDREAPPSHRSLEYPCLTCVPTSSATVPSSRVSRSLCRVLPQRTLDIGIMPWKIHAWRSTGIEVRLADEPSLARRFTGPGNSRKLSE